VGRSRFVTQNTDCRLQPAVDISIRPSHPPLRALALVGCLCFSNVLVGAVTASESRRNESSWTSNQVGLTNPLPHDLPDDPCTIGKGGVDCGPNRSCSRYLPPPLKQGHSASISVRLVTGQDVLGCLHPAKQRIKSQISPMLGGEHTPAPHGLDLLCRSYLLSPVSLSASFFHPHTSSLDG
jgi:hypothetical protein